MGQKVNPHGLRVGVIKDWDSRWFASKATFGDTLVEDYKIRELLKKKLYKAGVPSIEIERSGDKVTICISCAKPGMVIGAKGAEVDKLKAEMEKFTGKKVDIKIIEVKNPDMNAQLVAENIAQQLEGRVSFRRAMKSVIGRTMKSGAKGIKILCSGRLGGAEIARKEQYSEGNVPLHTLRADIDYGFAEADTTYGRIGVKVWINHGEILDKGLQSTIREDKREGGRKDRRGRRDDRRGGRRKFDRRDDHRAAKAVNPRKRKAPKAAPKAEQAESAPAEAQETNE